MRHESIKLVVYTGCQLGDGAAEALARALATNAVLQCLDLRGMRRVVHRR